MTENLLLPYINVSIIFRTFMITHIRVSPEKIFIPEALGEMRTIHIIFCEDFAVTLIFQYFFTGVGR